jgi:cysteine desulfurase
VIGPRVGPAGRHRERPPRRGARRGLRGGGGLARDAGCPRAARRFEAALIDLFGGRLSVNGAGAERLPNTCTVNFHGRAGADVLAALPGVAASTGSACHAGSVELSPVLAAMGVPPAEGMGAVRFSLGRTTTWDELEHVLARLASTRKA